MIRIWRRRQPLSLALISWKRSARIGAVLLVFGAGCSRGVCQSPSETVGHEASDSNTLQLSLQQAIRMALENNLDIRLEQIDQSVADFSLARTRGGAIPRSINYTITETPAGEVLATLPLLDSTASTLSPSAIQPSGITIPSSYDAGHVLEAQHSLSIATAPFSLGAPVPAFDLVLMGQYGWIRRDPSNALANSGSTAVDTTITNNTLANTFAAKGFSSGASLQVGINNFVDSYYSGRSSGVPYTHPNAYAIFAQPLLRGAGRKNNTRYIEIAKTNKKISAEILEQQIISTISGVESLYWDLVSLQNSVQVQQKALDAANRLLSDNRQQFDVGRMPPVDVARAEALVAASQLALTQAISLRDQQENVLRSVIDPQSLSTPNARLADIVAIDELSSAEDRDLAPIAELIQHAAEKRPDLRQAKLQVNNGERAVGGSANARLPELDVYGSFQSRGVISPDLVPVGGDPTTGAPALGSIPTGGVRASQILQAGIQFNVPVQNKVAEADLRADRAQLQQERLRLIQMEAQAAAEVRNAVIALNTAKQADQAAASARNLQEELRNAEVEKFRAGFSTTFVVIEQESYLTQAEAAEIAAQLALRKASVQLHRALGDTLERHGIDVDSGATNSKTPRR